ncbi:hypothetical protein [Vibrio parahaemolyticus]|uniref:hypothetical protein n=1 Tax=Vibrio parahaemolyticus TaxID=670 RepID=UPI00111FA729|nr:hypothetical protein [Vibrio parahaemolyticus]TOG91542.1 hypothetical protein CGI92_20660 [Vibrio parahaemolyticus]
MPNASKYIINQRLSNFIEDLSLGKTYAFCVRKHLSIIQELINDGYTILTISTIISEHRPILYASLRNAISNARKTEPSFEKQDGNTIQNLQKSDEIEKYQAQKSEQPIISDDTKMKWLKLQITSPTLIERLEKYCVSYDDVRSWNLASEFQVSKRLTELIVMKKVKSK